MDLVTIEAWLIVDEDGDFAVGVDREDAAGRYVELFGENGTAKRLVRIGLKVPRPRPAVVNAILPDEPAAELEDLEAEDFDEDPDLDEVEPA